MRAYRAPPSFSAISARKVKVIKPEPVLDIPVGLQTQYIRKWESIPDDYILKNFALETYRGERKKTTESVPLFKTLIEQLLNRPFTPPPARQNRYDDDDDEIDERLDSNRIDGKRITITELKNVFINFLNSEATLALFPAAKIYYLPWDEDNDDGYEDGGYVDEKEGGQLVPKEIFLCKEDVTYETDRAVMDKIKREVYTKISRWRRAKEKY